MRTRSFRADFTEYDSLAELNETDAGAADLVRAALQARNNAYAPYSHFLVGAAARVKRGKIVKGSNQENANCKVTCAERALLDRLGVDGLRKHQGILAMAVVGALDGQDSIVPTCPCGQCRQDLREWVDVTGPFPIFMASTNGPIIKANTIADLLPFGFGPADLGIDVTKHTIKPR